MGKKKKKEDKKIGLKMFYVLVVLVILLGSLNMAKAKGWLIPKEPELRIIDNTIDLEEMTLKQKIAQMVVVHGGRHNMLVWKNLGLGGIHLFAMAEGDLYKRTIEEFQEGMVIPFLVTVDLEGCWNPFANFKSFTAASEVGSVGEAFEKGYEEGEFLSSLGFSVNFAPVVDLEDKIWRCRSFPGDEKEVGELAEAYVLGLQNKGVMATAKHYPGKTLIVRDPHKYLVVAEISGEDVYPYGLLVEKGDVKGVMVSHVIVSGEVDSRGVPSVASGEVIGELRKDFGGLIVSDEINMLGLKKFYGSLEEMYIAVFKAGNDLVLNFNEDPNEIYHMISVVEEGVLDGEISEERIDESVKRILEFKGFEVKG